MKRFLFLLLVCVSCFVAGAAQAQELYGNEWIDYSKTYYKLKVTETGLYKLDHAYLSNLGIAGANPQHLQLFRRGKEVPIYVAGESDGRLDPQDYVEFFGERNDGVLDKELYKNPAHQVHQLHSMYTDTAAYFLTINTAGNNKRMREVNPAVDGRTSEPYHLQKALLVQTGTLQIGQPSGVNRMPWMDRGEGYFSNIRTSVQNFNITGITNVEQSGPAPILTYVSVGPNNNTHAVDINLINGTFSRNLKKIEYGSFDFSRNTQEILLTDINVNNKTLTLQLSPQTGSGAVGLAFAHLVYPQKNIFSGNAAFLYTDSLRSATQYFEYENAPATVVAYNITDRGAVVRTQGFVLGGTNRKGFVVSAGPASQQVLLAKTDQALVPVGKHEIVSFRNIVPADFNYFIVTNKKLMRTVGGSTNPAPAEYAAYRGSAAGGGYDPIVVFVDDLVNQFHYGEFSANALKRFSSYLAQSERLKFVFYMGKAYEVRMLNYKSAAAREKDLVPTGLGTHPGSDILFSTRFREGSYVPLFPTGRLSVKTAEEVMDYLNKIKEYDQAKAGEPWRKNILHLGGGKETTQIKQIAGFLNEYKNIAEGPLLGANVIQRTRQNLSETVEALNVSKEVNNGASLVTFFGHSSIGTTDLNIGNASDPLNNYRNKGKYPVLLMNGCNVGNSFVSDDVSFGEDWLKTPDKGAVALIAHLDGGYDLYLHNYSSTFYKVAFTDPAFYGKTLGEVQKETIRRLSGSARNNEFIAMLLEMVLQGDPAIKLYNPEKPDYLVENNSFSIENLNGERATAVEDTLVLSFNLVNMGKAIDKPLYMSLKRILPDNSVQQIDSIKAEPVYLKRKVSIKIPNKGFATLGMNTFEVKVDSPEAIDELDEENNTAVFQKYLSASGLVATFPRNYSIIGSEKVTLSVQSTAEKDINQGVYFEIDTASTFKSPWVKNETIANANYAPWDFSLPVSTASDSVVYYWRARFNTYSTGEDTVWVNSSFRYIPDVDAGWSQSHKGQFTQALTANIDSLNQQDGVWKFKTIRKFIDIKTVGGDEHFADPPYGLFIDSEQQLNYYCGNPTYYKYTQPRFYIIAFNNLTLEPVTDIPGQIMCPTYPYIFDTNDLNKAANIAKLVSFINAIPEGYHVAVIGMQNIPFSAFTDETKAVFKSIGSKLIDELKTGDPFAMVGRKGATPGTAKELTFSKDDPTPASSQSIELNVTLESTRQAGTITSTTIGPALKWGSLHHNIEKYKGGNDKYKLSLIGVDANGAETVLQERVQAKSLNISYIDAAVYPNLKLSAFLSDSTARTAPQLKEWFVLYEAAPEGVIRPDLVKAGTNDLSPLAGRGSLTIPMAFQNLTSTAFTDSLTVEVTLSGDGLQPTTSTFKIKPAGPEETVMFSHTLDTKQFEGDYKVSMYVNPRILPEQEYGNNIYEVTFNVKSKLHPIMNVAFDGIQILDGDIVSPSPLISVVVKDENDYVFLKDPSQMSVVMVNEFEVATEINLMNNPQEVKYVPATEKSDFKLEYKPNKLEDGKYRLEVRAKDAVGKDSGVTPYRIGFEVISESSVTNFYPFPNPFSTKTNFIFTLTGSTIPEHMKIQILTVTGKVVKEIMKEELGPLRIGNNKTEYAWDGTDMYGDKLANGVYLYRVIMSKGQEEMKHRITFGDKAFKNGYGKLYILR